MADKNFSDHSLVDNLYLIGCPHWALQLDSRDHLSNLHRNDWQMKDIFSNWISLWLKDVSWFFLLCDGEKAFLFIRAQFQVFLLNAVCVCTRNGVHLSTLPTIVCSHPEKLPVSKQDVSVVVTADSLDDNPIAIIVANCSLTRIVSAKIVVLLLKEDISVRVRLVELGRDFFCEFPRPVDRIVAGCIALTTAHHSLIETEDTKLALV